MKKILLILINVASLISCKAQEADTMICYTPLEYEQIREKLDSADIYKNEAVYFKEIYNEIYNNGDYYRSLEFIDAKGGEFFFYNKEDYTKTIIKQEGKKYEFRLIDANIEFWYSRWVDTVYSEQLIFRLPLDVLK